MLKSFGKIADKFLVFIVIVLVVVGLRESLLSDSNQMTALKSLLETFPFCKLMVDLITKIISFQTELPKFTAHSFLTDLFRLAIMALLQGTVMTFVYSMFLRIPAGSWSAQEDYMNSPAYKVKEALMKVIFSPVVALAAAYLTQQLYDWLEINLGEVGSVIIGGLIALLAAGLSVLPLLATTSLLSAVAWRIGVTFGSKMISTFMTNLMCMFVFLALIGGVPRQIVMSIIMLFATVLVLDIFTTAMKYTIVGSTYGK